MGLCFFGNCVNKHYNNERKAFSIAEAMVTLLIVSVIAAVSAPIMSKNIKNSNISGLELRNLERRLEQLITNLEQQTNQQITNLEQQTNQQITNLQQQVNNAAIPAGTVAFFNSANCPTGWTQVSKTWNGRYPSFAGDYIYCNGSSTAATCTGTNGTSVKNNSVGTLYGDAIRNITGVGPSFINYGSGGTVSYYVNLGRISGAFRNTFLNTSNVDIRGAGNLGNNQGGNLLDFNASRVVPTAAVNRPRTVVLLGCQKN